MNATVTFLRTVVPPERLAELREAERERREQTRCPDPKCRLLKPNHSWACGLRGGDGPEGGEAA